MYFVKLPWVTRKQRSTFYRNTPGSCTAVTTAIPSLARPATQQTGYEAIL
jgi:hypothetical protein